MIVDGDVGTFTASFFHQRAGEGIRKPMRIRWNWMLLQGQEIFFLQELLPYNFLTSNCTAGGPIQLLKIANETFDPTSIKPTKTKNLSTKLQRRRNDLKGHGLNKYPANIWGLFFLCHFLIPFVTIQAFSLGGAVPRGYLSKIKSVTLLITKLYLYSCEN